MVDTACGPQWVEQWRYELEERPPGAPVVANDAVYVPAVDGILELDPAEATERQVLESGLRFGSKGTSAVTGDGLYVSGYEQVLALSLDDGSELWQADVAPDGSEVSSGPMPH